MALPFTVDSLDSVDESARALYVEQDGKFRLDVEGYEDPAGLKDALQNERTAARDARNKLKALETQFEGIDPQAIKDLLEKDGQNEEAKLIAQGKLDEVVSRRTERLRTEHARQLQAEKDRADAAEKLSEKLRESALADAVRSAAVKAGALSEASDDFVFRARGQFAFNEDGQVVAIDRDGQVVYGKDGKTPLSPQEWAESLKDTAPHLWPRPSGAGAPGNNGGKATKSFNEMTEAERVALHRSNPEKYRQLRDASNQKE